MERSLHPVVRAAVRNLQTEAVGPYGKISSALGGLGLIAASPGQIARAAEIADMMIRACVMAGCKIKLSEGRKALIYSGEEVRISVTEHSKQIPARPRTPRGPLYIERKYEYTPTGEMWIEVQWRLGKWRAFDGREKSVTNKLPTLADFLKAIPIEVKRIAEREEARRKLHEAVARKREERERISASIRRAKESLDAETANWHRATAMRAYVDHIEARLGEHASEDLKDWIRWARSYAHSLDPTQDRLANKRVPAPLQFEGS